MKVLHIIPGFGGGISSFVKNLSIGNSNKKVIYDVLGFNAFPDEYTEIIQNQNGMCFSLPSVHKHPFKMFAEYKAILKKGKYNILHCHYSGYRGFIFKIIARKYGIKRIVTHAHRTSDERKGAFHFISVGISQRLSCSSSTDYFACSKMAGEHIFGGLKIHGQEVVVIPNSVDTDKFIEPLSRIKKQKYFEELNLPSECKIVGHIGRFNIQKNHRFILNIAKALRESKMNFRILLIGDGELFNEIEAKVKNEGLENYVLFLGKRSDVASLIKIFDVMILPSFFEGLPTVAIEAQVAGVHCLLSDRITTEADMEMGLIQFLNIEQIDIWKNAIQNIKVSQLSEMERLKEVEKHGFTILAMQKKYVHVFSNT